MSDLQKIKDVIKKYISDAKCGIYDCEGDPTNSFWDLLVYNRELTNKEVDDYDLKYLGEEDD